MLMYSVCAVLFMKIGEAWGVTQGSINQTAELLLYDLAGYAIDSRQNFGSRYPYRPSENFEYPPYYQKPNRGQYGLSQYSPQFGTYPQNLGYYPQSERPYPAFGYHPTPSQFGSQTGPQFGGHQLGPQYEPQDGGTHFRPQYGFQGGGSQVGRPHLGPQFGLTGGGPMIGGPHFGPQFAPQTPPQFGPPFERQHTVMEVLYSIAKNDKLRCVPRLLCEVTSDTISRGSRQSLSLPTLPLNINMESIIGILSTIDEASGSPITTFAKAALLGYASKGNSENCINSYPRCPRDPERLIQYLNNYNGGFFRFFNGINPQPSSYPGLMNYSPNFQGLSNYLTKLQGQAGLKYPSNYQGTLNYPSSFQQGSPSYLNSFHGQPQLPSSQGLSNYPANLQGLSSPYYKNNLVVPAEQRIQNKPVQYVSNDYNTGLAGGVSNENGILFPSNNDVSAEIRPSNLNNRLPKRLTFPTSSDVDSESSGLNWFRKPKELPFSINHYYSNELDFQRPLPNHQASPMIFPDRTGTGDLRLDADELNENLFYYNNQQQHNDERPQFINQNNLEHNRFVNLGPIRSNDAFYGGFGSVSDSGHRDNRALLSFPV